MTTDPTPLQERIARALYENAEYYGPEDAQPPWDSRDGEERGEWMEIAAAVLPLIAAAREAVPALLDALSAAERRATRAEAQSETRRQQAVYWQERAEGFEARIADTLALCDEWAAMGTRPMNIGAVRRALDAP